ncbi:MAG: hypothetical protein ACLRM9_03690 [Collinsella aerofaciens]
MEEGDAPRRVYCASTATRPSRLARLWQECGDASSRAGAGRRDGLRAQQMRRGPQRAQRRQENSRNGYRPRSLKTAVGDVELEIRQHGTYYPRHARAMVARRHLGGRHRAGDVPCPPARSSAWRPSWAYSLSSSEVSSLCSDLDAEVAEFRSRDRRHAVLLLWLDATYAGFWVGSRRSSRRAS